MKKIIVTLIISISFIVAFTIGLLRQEIFEGLSIIRAIFISTMMISIYGTAYFLVRKEIAKYDAERYCERVNRI